MGAWLTYGTIRSALQVFAWLRKVVSFRFFGPSGRAADFQSCCLRTASSLLADNSRCSSVGPVAARHHSV